MAIRQGQRSGGSRCRGARSAAQAGRAFPRRRRWTRRRRPRAEQRASTASALVVIALVWASFGFYRVDAAERGVEFRFGAFQGLTPPGLQWHWPWPIERAEKINTGATERLNYRAQHAHEGREHRQRRARRAVQAHGSAELPVQLAQSGGDARSGDRERHSRGRSAATCSTSS